jgi:hypothetical protein
MTMTNQPTLNKPAHSCARAFHDSSAAIAQLSSTAAGRDGPRARIQ